jgi:L-glyceraldehyde 3-phosphate reductase
MALSWILRDQEVTSVLIGASKLSQILENTEIVRQARFEQEELLHIEEILRG